MNRSEAEVADVPPGVMTVMSMVPVPAGAIAVMEVSLLNVYEVAGVDPNFTAVTPVNAVPEMDTEVPPRIVPFGGEMPVTVGRT